MSQDLVRSYQGGTEGSGVSRSVARRTQKSVGQSLAIMSSRHVLDVARIRAEEDLQVERLHAVESITSEGVMSAAMVMNRARLLMDMNPMDAGMIQSVAQIGVMEVARVVQSTGRRLS